MQMHFWGDAPETGGLYFNNTRQIAKIVASFSIASQTPITITVRSPSESVADGAIRHVAEIISELERDQPEVFWFVAYPASTYADVGISLRRFFLKLWQERELNLIRTTEYEVLGYEITETSDSFEYFTKNIHALATRLNYVRALFVLDLQKATQEALPGIRQLISKILAVPNAAFRGAILIGGTNWTDPADIELEAPNNNLVRLLDQHRSIRLEPEQSSSAKPDELGKVAALIHPLVLLGQPAQEAIVDYIATHFPYLEQDIKRLAESETLWKLSGNSFRLSPHGFRQSKTESGSAFPPWLKDTIPNGAKILSFQSPSRLLPQYSTLRDLDKVLSETNRAVDLFALALGQRKSGYGSAFRDSVEELTIFLKNTETWNGQHSRSLLCYCSQMLLTQPAEFAPDFFSIFEYLTYCFANSCYLKGGPDGEVYEASRWITNLGYVHDQIRGHLSYRSAGRASIYSKAARYLKNLHSDDMIIHAQLRYAEAWQLYDAGCDDAATSIFIESAANVYRIFKAGVVKDIQLKILAQELLLAALVISPEISLPEHLSESFCSYLDDYGSRFSLLEIMSAFQNFSVLDDGIKPSLVSPDVLVLSSVFDLHVALLIATEVKRANRYPRIVSMPRNATYDDVRTKLFENCCLTIVIASPDTPALGSVVSELDAELVRLYSMRLTGEFACFNKIKYQNSNIVVLSACGLGGNIRAWQNYAHQFYKEFKLEVSQMDDVILEYLVKPLLSIAEGRIFTALVDSIVNRLPGKRKEVGAALESLRNTTPEVAANKIASFNVEIKALLVDASTLTSSTSTLSDVMTKLGTVNLDLVQLKSFTEMAYSLASSSRKKLEPGSEAEIKIGYFVKGFRDQRTEASHALDMYRATGEMDHRKMNDLAEKLSNSLRNFQTAAEKIFY